MTSLAKTGKGHRKGKSGEATYMTAVSSDLSTKARPSSVPGPAKDDSPPPPQHAPLDSSRSSSPFVRGAPERKSISSNPVKEQPPSFGQQIKNFISPNYKTRSEQFRKLFKAIPETEKFVFDYSCAFQREILVHGRMYLGQSHVCFYANIFKWETCFTIPFRDIVHITKERTAMVIPNAMQMQNSSGEKFFFTSFGSRDKAYLMVFRLWQYALLDKVVSPLEMWNWAQQGYHATDTPVCDVSVTEDEEERESDITGENSPFNVSFDIPPPTANGDSPPVKQPPPSSTTATDETPRPLLSSGTLNGDAEDQHDDGTLTRSKTLINSKSSPVLRASATESPEEKERRQKRLDDGAQKRRHQLETAVAAEDEVDDSSETDGEVACPCAEHEGRRQLDSVYPISVEQMFSLLFTDSAFFVDFIGRQKKTGGTRFFDYKSTDWKVDKETGAKERSVSYSVTINHAMMAQKSCQATEKQVCQRYGSSGGLAVVRKETSNHGVPYADNFYVATTYCISRVAANVCRLKVHSGIVYTKSIWGIVKTFIEKSTYQGLSDHYTALESNLIHECSRLGFVTAGTAAAAVNGVCQESFSGANNTPPSTESLSKTVKRRKGRLTAGSCGETATGAGPDQQSTPVNAKEGLASSSTVGMNGSAFQRSGSFQADNGSYAALEWTAKGTLLVMILMLVLNCGLMYKLYTIDVTRNSRPNDSSQFLTDLKVLLSSTDLKSDDVLKIYHMHRQQSALNSIQNTVSSLTRIELQLRELKDQLDNAKNDLTFVEGVHETSHYSEKFAASQSQQV